MDSFNEYLDKKKECSEYTTSYQLDEGFWDNLKHGVKGAFRNMGSANRVKSYAVSVKLNNDEIMKKIIKDAKAKASDGAAPDYKTEIRNMADTIAEAMFKTAGGKVEHDGWSEANVSKDFIYLTVNRDKITAYFKASAKDSQKEKKDPEAAAKSFKRQLIDNVCTGLPHIPESSIKIEVDEDTKGHQQFMGQLKKEWVDVKKDIQGGIDDLVDYLDNKMPDIQKELDKKSISVDRDNQLGEDTTMYYLRWIIKPESFDTVIYDATTGVSRTTAPDLDTVAKAIANYVNELLTKKKFIEPDGSSYKLTKENHGYVGMSTTESSIRFYFKDKTLAETAQEMLSELEGIGSVNTVKRPAMFVETLDAYLNPTEFVKYKLFKRVIVPYLNRGQQLYTANVVFTDDQKEEFNALITGGKADDSAIKKFISNFIRLGNTEVRDDFIGVGASKSALFAYCTSKGAANRLASIYANNSYNAKVGTSPVILDADALKYLAVTKDESKADDKNYFGNLIETLKKIAEAGWCETTEYAFISIPVNSNIVEIAKKDNADFNEDKAAENIANYLKDALDAGYADSSIALIGPFIDGPAFNIAFKYEKDNKDAIEKYFIENFRNKGFADSKLSVVSLSKKFAGLHVSNDITAAIDNIKKNAKPFIDACKAANKEMVAASEVHKVINIALSEDSYKAFAQNLKDTDTEENKFVEGIKKIIDSDTDNILQGFYILNNNIRFIIDPKAENGVDNIKNEVERNFTDTKITEISERYSVTTLQLYADFKNDVSKAKDQAADIIAKIVAQNATIKAQKELDNRTKLVVFAPINELANAKGDFAEKNDNAFEYLKKAIQNTLNEISKYKSSDKNPNYCGYYICKHNNKPCVAYVFNKSEANSIDWYKEMIAGHDNANTVDAKTNYVIPAFEMEYIEATKEDLNNLDENHIKVFLQQLDEFDNKVKAEKEKEAKTCYNVEVGIDTDAWAQGLSGNNTSLSNDEVTKDILEAVIKAVQECKTIDGFLGVLPDQDSIMFVCKTNTAANNVINIIPSIMKHAKHVGRNQSYKVVPSEYEISFQKELKNENITNVEQLSKLFTNIFDKATSNVENNKNNFEWALELDFDGIDKKYIKDLVKIEGTRLNVVRLVKNKHESTFSDNLNNYLLKLLNENTGKKDNRASKVDMDNAITDGDAKDESLAITLFTSLDDLANVNDAQDYNQRLEDLLKTSGNLEINKITKLKEQFIKHFKIQLINDAKIYKVTAKCELDGNEHFRLDFTGKFDDCKKYYEYVTKLAEGSFDLFKIISSTTPKM